MSMHDGWITPPPSHSFIDIHNKHPPKTNRLILDELNLAPPEVLEGLNRLLDDNRELLIPETQVRLVLSIHSI